MAQRPSDATVYSSAIDAFRRVAAALVEEKELDDLLHVVAGEVCALVGVGRCSIHLRDGADMFRGYVGHAGEDIDHYVKRARAGMPADGITREILATKRAVIVRDARTDPRPVQSTVRFWGIRSIMAVPMIFDDEVIGILFLDDEAHAHHFTETDEAIASLFADLAAVAISHAKVLNEKNAKLLDAQRQVAGLKRAALLDERLSEIVLEGGGLSALAAATADLLGKPCAIHGATHELLAAASPRGVGDGVVPQLLEPRFRSRPQIARAFAPARAHRVLLVGPLPDSGLPHRYIVAPFEANDEPAGTLVVMEHLSRVSGVDMFLARRAAAHIGRCVALQCAALGEGLTIGGGLLAELVHDGGDNAALSRIACQVGLQLDCPHRVCLLARRDEPSALSVLEVSAAFATAGEDVYAAPVEDGIAVLLDDRADDTATLVERVERALGGIGGDVRAAVSQSCEDLDRYPEAFADARQALQCLLKLGTAESPAVVTADELGPGRLFLAALDAPAALAFTERTIGMLMTDPGAGTLIETLDRFFADMASVRLCAMHLGVHENTVRYRLARVCELTGLSVTGDPDAQLAVRMALLIFRLRGMTDARRVSDVRVLDKP